MAHVQTANFADAVGATFAEATLGTTTTTGNFLVCTINYVLANTGFSSVTDDGGHTWQQAGSEQARGGSANRIYYAENITGRAAHKVRFTCTGILGFPTIVVSEHSGIATSSSLDKTNGGNSTSTTPASGTTASRTDAAELMIGSMATAGGDTTISAGTNVAWTIPTNGKVEDGSIHNVTAIEYFYASSSGTEQAEFTITTSDPWMCLVATFKLAAGGTTFTLVGNTGTFTETGKTALFKASEVASKGTFTETGVAALFKTSQTSVKATFAETGVAALFKINFVDSKGTFVLSGKAAEQAWPAGKGTFTETGVAALFRIVEAANKGTFVLTGQNATLASGTFLSGGTGTFSETGKAALFIVKMSLNKGTFNLTGRDASLTSTLDTPSLSEIIIRRRRRMN